MLSSRLCDIVLVFVLYSVIRWCVFLMIRRPPRSTRTDTLFPYTTLFRSKPISAILSISDSAIALSCGLGACDATTRARPWFQRWRPGERPWPRLRSRTMPVQGIGGLFFRARDPEGLADWYRRHLGIGAGWAAAGTGQPDQWVGTHARPEEGRGG